MIQPELDFNARITLAENLKEQGISRILENNDEFKTIVLEHIIYISHRRDTFTIDDVRRDCQPLQPSNCKLWGAVMHAAARLNLIVKTGQYVKSSLPTSHAREVPVWRRNE